MFPEPVISIAIEPKTQADVDKLGVSLQKLAYEDPSFRTYTNEETGQTIIAGMGELHLEIIVDRLKREFKVEANVGKPEVAYREAISKKVAARGQVRPADRRPRPVRPRAHRDRAGRARQRASSSRTTSSAASSRRSSFPSIEKGIREALGRGVLAGYPDHRREGAPLRRQLPRGRFVGSGLRDRGIDGVPGRRQARRHPPARADDEGRGRRPGHEHGRRHRRSELASRHDPGHEPARQHAQVIDAEVPLATMFGYATDLRSKTQGRATYTMQFSHYEAGAVLGPRRSRREGSREVASSARSRRKPGSYGE